MKKLLSLILVALMVVPFGMLAATTASAAAETTLYVKTGGTGSGTSEDQPLGSIESAMDVAVQLTTDVKIVVCGEVTFDVSNNYNEAEHSNKITITGKDANAKLLVKTGSSKAYYMNGELCIEKIAIDITAASTWQIITQFHDITFGEGVKVENTSGAATVGYITLRVTIKGTTIAFDESTGGYEKDAKMTLKSGRFSDVCFCNGTSTKGNSNKSFTVYVSGDAQITNLVTSRGGTSAVADSTITLDGGMIERFVGASDRPVTSFTDTVTPGVTNSFTLVITKNFDISKSWTGVVDSNVSYQGISGTTTALVTDDALLSKADYVLKVDESVYDAVVARVQANTFDKIEKVAETSAPADTTTPTTPTNPTTPSNPETGDSTVVLAVIASFATAVAATVVIAESCTSLRSV